jgi:hypothetical protein
VGAVYSQTGVLAKGRAKGSAGEIEELGRELGLAGARDPPRGGDIFTQVFDRSGKIPSFAGYFIFI